MSLEADGADMPSAPLAASGERELMPLKAVASFIVGLVLLSAVVLLWVFSSALTQFLYNDPDLDYEKPGRSQRSAPRWPASSSCRSSCAG